MMVELTLAFHDPNTTPSDFGNFLDTIENTLIEDRAVVWYVENVIASAWSTTGN